MTLVFSQYTTLRMTYLNACLTPAEGLCRSTKHGWAGDWAVCLAAGTVLSLAASLELGPCRNHAACGPEFKLKQPPLTFKPPLT